MSRLCVVVNLLLASLFHTKGFNGRLFSRQFRSSIRPFQELTRLQSSIPEVSDISERSALLKWPEIEGARSYRIEFIRDNGPYNMIVVTSPNISLKSLTPGAKYDYRVYAIERGPQSSSSIAYTGSFITSKQTTPSSDTVKAEVTELSRLEIRVGKIIEISKHPEADSLYVEKVDVGEPEPRTIVSGLVEFCSLESLLNRNVVVLCNLKPRPLKGITSFGMLLCASDESKTQVDPVKPPAGASVGQLITFEGHASEPAEPGNRASKAFAKVADDFFVNEQGVATYKGIAFMTPAGPCESHLKGKIS